MINMAQKNKVTCRHADDIDGLKVGDMFFLRLKLGAVLIYDTTMDFLGCVTRERARHCFGHDCLDNLEPMQ